MPAGTKCSSLSTHARRPPRQHGPSETCLWRKILLVYSWRRTRLVLRSWEQRLNKPRYVNHIRLYLYVCMWTIQGLPCANLRLYHMNLCYPRIVRTCTCVNLMDIKCKPCKIDLGKNVLWFSLYGYLNIHIMPNLLLHIESGTKGPALLRVCHPSCRYEQSGQDTGGGVVCRQTHSGPGLYSHSGLGS